VSILDALLNANIPLVGISVLEVLNALFSHLITAPTDEIQQGLIHSIGGLGSQTYYHNQLNDITAYIVSKLRVGAAPNTTMDGMSLVQYRKVVLQCLVATHEKYNSPKSAQNNDTESSENVSVYGNLVTLEAWIPALGLLLDPNSGMHLSTNKKMQLGY
jgi:hypothetical protein